MTALRAALSHPSPAAGRRPARGAVRAGVAVTVAAAVASGAVWWQTTSPAPGSSASAGSDSSVSDAVVALPGSTLPLPGATAPEAAVPAPAVPGAAVPDAGAPAGQVPMADAPPATASPADAAGPPADAPAVQPAAPGPAEPPTAPDAGGSQPGTLVPGAVLGGAAVAGGAVVAAGAQSLSVEQFGAVGNGVSDDTRALQRAFDTVPSGTTLVFRPGATYLHSDVLRVTRPGLTLVGTGATLTATQETRSALHVSGDRVTLTGLTLALPTSTQRFHAYEQMKVRVSGDDVVLRDVHVRGAAAAGIYVGNGAARFLLDRVTVANSRADGVHVTGGARDGRVVSPVTTNTGDDGVAVVSYQADGRPVERVRITSPRVNGTTWGRGISVVGGTDITYTDIDVRDTDAGGVYLGSEGDPYWTYPSVRVLVDGGRVSGANTNPEKDHGAVIVYAGNPGTSTADVTVRRLAISGTRASAPWDVGVLAEPGATAARVTLAELALSRGAQAPFWTNVPSAVRLIGVRDDGAGVADRTGW
ncbi:glycosyl hydrolase family 28-related protein [Modestobacter sp. SYSU DS0657]